MNSSQELENQIITHLIKDDIGQVRRVDKMRDIENFRLTQVNDSWSRGISGTRKILLKNKLDKKGGLDR